MTEWHEFSAVAMKYDGEKDGIWVYDEDGPAVFLGRGAIVRLVSVLADGEREGKKH